MNNQNVLNTLIKRNNSLKSKLISLQIQNDTYPFDYVRKYSMIVINEYKKHRSIFKSASNANIDYNTVLNWYIQGQLGNSKFRDFYLAIENINTETDVSIKKDDSPVIENNADNVETLNGVYEISQYGDGWSYKTYVGGEKIFIISNDLDNLKKKVKAKNLPLED